jgi:hypothetical protein
VKPVYIARGCSVEGRRRASDYRVELVRVSKFVIRVSGLMDGLTRYNIY